MKDTVQTVSGNIPADDMGVTLSHEHCLLDITCYFKEPEEEFYKKAAYEPLTLENVGYFRYHWHNNRDDMLLEDETVAANELAAFKQFGGRTVIDATNVDIGRNPEALQRISAASGLNIVMGSGYYVRSAHRDPHMDRRSEEEFAQELIGDIRDGVGSSGIRSGIIGEIGVSWPMDAVEKKVLRAAGMAQKETGAPLVIHPGISEDSPAQIMDLLSEVGADLSHTVLIHMGRTLFRADYRYKVAEAGCFLEFDAFGQEGYWPDSLITLDIPNDAQRIGQIKDLIDHGFGDQILISHDIAHKARYLSFGGHGYAHILTNVVPAMRSRGISETDIDRLLIENPKRFFPIR